MCRDTFLFCRNTWLVSACVRCVQDDEDEQEEELPQDDLDLPPSWVQPIQVSQRGELWGGECEGVWVGCEDV